MSRNLASRQIPGTFCMQLNRPACRAPLKLAYLGGNFSEYGAHKMLPPFIRT